MVLWGQMPIKVEGLLTKPNINEENPNNPQTLHRVSRAQSRACPSQNHYKMHHRLLSHFHYQLNRPYGAA